MSVDENSPTLFPWRAPLAADWSTQWAALDERVRALRESTPREECDAIVLAARRLAGQALGSSEHLKLESLARRMLRQAEQFPRLRHFRIGVTGNRTLSYLAAPLQAAGLVRGMLVEAFEIPYDLALAAALGARSTLQRRKLDAAVIVLDACAFTGSDVFLADDRDAYVLGEARTILERLVSAVSEATGSPAIVATIPSGGSNVSSSDLALPGSPSRLSMQLNQLIVEGAQRRDWVMWDLAALASRVGSAAWYDAVRFHEAKTPFRIELGPLVADHLCRTVAALAGKSCRALVLDLDNTLWGGEIGDDGVSGIRLGENSAEGEAYLSFQRFVLNLRRRGIVLAVCSKNSDAIAREAFHGHPEMLLREEHIAVFQANWEDKATNLKAIAEALDLDLESLAFADDNAAERERVRQELPQVSVPEIGSEPAHYASRIADSGVFEHMLLTIDDQSRAESYQSRAAGAELKSRIGNYDEYLQSLQMSLSVSRFDSVGRARIVQLINKSNQFNLTTRRYHELEVKRFEEAQDDILCWQVRLDDAFGAHGIIGIIIVRKESTVWTIDTWLMSCRVLMRGIEEALMNLLMAEGRRKGAEAIVGEYIETPRNGLVADFFPRMGFTAIEKQLETRMQYRAHPASHQPMKNFIDVQLS
jgi:FkbH-like protein